MPSIHFPMSEQASEQTSERSAVGEQNKQGGASERVVGASE